MCHVHQVAHILGHLLLAMKTNIYIYIYVCVSRSSACPYTETPSPGDECIYIYICVHIYIYMYMYVCVYIYIYIYICVTLIRLPIYWDTFSWRWGLAGMDPLIIITIIIIIMTIIIIMIIVTVTVTVTVTILMLILIHILIIHTHKCEGQSYRRAVNLLNIRYTPRTIDSKDLRTTSPFMDIGHLLFGACKCRDSHAYSTFRQQQQWTVHIVLKGGIRKGGSNHEITCVNVICESVSRLT